MTDHTPMPVLHLLYRKEITYTLQLRFCKVDYRSVNVQCPYSTQDNIDDGSGGSDVGI